MCRRDQKAARGRYGPEPGALFGRHIWQRPAPATMVRALRHLIRDGGTVALAAELLA